ncbi:MULTISPECIES: nucleoside hydrolase [unclassified Paracoccus (in: a-proteobacteria)]|uniref:nucleoside hydrolase n=1 Tax=unclassified Paracoccus (in: a-proteobacteria) TaxID=2688777 RepID=UPI0015FEF78F|nr:MULTISPECIES: nucleoside hydrolase [unclassified Paracoccus (in: a-proteobacteria)]MBB1490840.1 nucleoside hydrolase [Paracoccus sp. MC1854]MBB1497816.1 nucleoside hydrolase [Paracoccus sp. MC1862]QQO45293.1 nucleoside hydrolase [Paracoccus sp. MC1862]
MTQKIIIDTDPGQDDAVAILLALGAPELEVLGLTVVAGNVPLSLTLRNALQICELAGRRDLPVHAGCEAPLEGRLITAEHIHGETGLAGVDLPEPTMPVAPGHAADFIVETIRREPAGSVTLVPIGPLTNIAEALRRAPDIAGRVGRIVLMGGGTFGNVTPAAEFNIHVDPLAAAEVFASGADLVVLPLDATHRALTSRDWIETMRATGPIGAAVAGWTSSYERFDREKYSAEGAPLHDPCAVAWVIDPSLFTGRRVNVEIETGGHWTRGMTVADWWGATDRALNALFIRDLDRDRLFDLMTHRISRLDAEHTSATR